ncbi:Regulatory solute carrier protein family 1 member 1 [Colius striatus]|uniref:Regulatory solute carrier protein family 1 member 1 n=1 Tax=Colius striatus TaxID=57412 RepID=A0A091KP64_COLST|nr:Regulatory solute carrier protein family 1 member 1 [Colius striatus]
MPSLPASDGFQNPVQSSGLNSKICNPTNQLLDRSVSAPASICSSKSSLTEPIDPRAAKSFESSTGCQITPEKEHPLLLQHLSNNASLANKDPSPQAGEGTCCNPTCLSQKTLRETSAADSLQECNAKEQNQCEGHLLEAKSLTDTAAKHGQNQDVCLSAEQEQKHQLPTDHQTCKEPEKEHLEEQTETTAPEPPCHGDGIEKPVVEEASQPANPPTERRGDGQEEAGLSHVKGSIHMSASHSCVHMETFMETDVIEQSIAEGHSSASERSVSDQNSAAFSMEVELLKCASSSSDLLSTGDTPQSKSTGETPAKCDKLSDLVAEDSPSPSSIHQLDVDPVRPSEEPCFSLASALKELHKLLVISRKGEGTILASEETSQLAVVDREPAAQQKRLSGEEQKGSDPASQEQSCSFCEVRSEGGRAEGNQQPCEGKQPCDSAVAKLSTGPVSAMQSAPGEGALEIQKSSGKSDLLVVNSAATSDQQQSSEQTEVWAGGCQSPSGLISEQNTPVSSAPALDEDALGANQSLFTGAPGRSSSSAPEDPRPLGGCEEPLLSPPAVSTGLPHGAPSPPPFPTAAVHRILSAGFTTQEALEALEQADGNTDLALLILLAKSIVVPT